MPDHIEDMPLRRTENGYYEEDDRGHAEECDTDNDRCAPGDDEYDESRHVPGTPDDLPYTYGEEHAEPADMHLSSGVVEWQPDDTREPKEDLDDELKDPNFDSDLWKKQQGLISIDEDAGYEVEEFTPVETEEIAEAIGDDAAERNQELPGGTSATGSVSTPEHGGFPEEE